MKITGIFKYLENSKNRIHSIECVHNFPTLKNSKELCEDKIFISYGFGEDKVWSLLCKAKDNKWFLTYLYIHYDDHITHLYHWDSIQILRIIKSNIKELSN